MSNIFTCAEDLGPNGLDIAFLYFTETSNVPTLVRTFYWTATLGFWCIGVSVDDQNAYVLIHEEENLDKFG